jgi:hypothetical protein
MSSQFFDKIVKVMDNTVELGNSREFVMHQCRIIGQTPDELRPENGGLFVMKLMSSLSDRLSKRDWDALDRGFKNLLFRNIPKRGKIKGAIITGTFEYVAKKQGRLTLNEIRKRICAPNLFREDGWYPVGILEEILQEVNYIMSYKGGLRSRSVGRYIISGNFLRNGDYLFGKDQPSTLQAFRNLGEVTTLTNFSLHRKNEMVYLSYEGDYDGHFQEFLMGLCDGIFKLRNIFPSSVEHVCEDGCSTMILRFSFPKKELVR